jgi:hypothetical protein
MSPLRMGIEIKKYDIVQLTIVDTSRKTEDGTICGIPYAFDVSNDVT